MNALAVVATTLLTILALYAIQICRHLFRSRRSTQKIFDKIDTALKNRRDLVYSLVQNAEKLNLPLETKQKLQEAFSHADSAKDMHEKSSCEHVLGILIKNTLAHADSDHEAAWKDVKENFDRVENWIEEARREYNQCARMFNARVEHFPANVFARVLSLKEMVFL